MDRDEVGRVWTWVSTTRKKTIKERPHVVLPHGFLYENTRADYHICCNSLNHIALMPNHDILIGPDLQGGNKEELNQAWRDFWRDTVYLKNAVTNGSIKLDELPILVKG